ncbi:hypothetical protein ACTFQN_20850 [Bacillus cereus group sp. MYBK30-1]
MDEAMHRRFEGVNFSGTLGFTSINENAIETVLVQILQDNCK